MAFGLDIFSHISQNINEVTSYIISLPAIVTES